MNDLPKARQNRLVWLFLPIVIVLGLTGVYLFYLNRNTPVPASWASAAGPRDSLIDWFNIVQQSIVGPVLMVLLGILIFRQRANHVIGWLFIFIGIYSAFMVVVQEWAVLGYFTSPTAISGSALAAWVTNWAWIPLMSLILLMLALFPDGSFLSRRWKVLFIVLLSVFVATGLLSSFVEPQLSSAFQIANPFPRLINNSLSESIFNITFFIFPVTALCTLAALLLRYRRSAVRQREQIKWLLIGVAFFVAMVVGGVTLSAVWGSTIGQVMVNAAFIAPVLGVGIAMLRHQLYDVDILIRRSTLYAILTALLALIYFGSIIVLQRLLEPVTGDSTIAVALSTLLIAALFLPLRRRVQDAIDRRFFRRKYDAEKTLEAFAATVRNETDLDALTAELVRVIQETMQPESVSVWLKPIDEPRSSVK